MYFFLYIKFIEYFRNRIMDVYARIYLGIIMFVLPYILCKLVQTFQTSVPWITNTIYKKALHSVL